MKKLLGTLLILFFLIPQTLFAASIQGDLSTNLTSVWLTDSSGLTTDLHGSNDLTNDGVALTTGVQGDAGDFELSETDHLTISDASASGLDFGTSDFTIAAWINLESAPGTNVNYGIAGKNASDAGWSIEYRDSSGTKAIRFSTGIGSSNVNFDVTTTLSTATDYRLVFTRVGTTGRIYLNGSLVGTGSTSGSIPDGADFYIGRRSASSYFDGVINQVVIVNGTAWDSDDVTTDYNAGAGIPYAGAGVVVQNTFFNFGGI